jgi:hypothetical protein
MGRRLSGIGTRKSAKASELREECHMNRLALSDDRMELTISDGTGRRTTLRSARPNGFTAADLGNACNYQFSKTLVCGQINRARKFSVIGRAIYVHIGTGPPTWWLPRARIGKRELMLGWLQVMLAASVGREDGSS